MAQTKSHKWKMKLFFSLVIFSLCIAYVVMMTKTSLHQNVESRALSEMQSTVNMQADAFADQLNEQFQPLYLVADMLSNGRHFTSEKIKPTLEAIVRTFRLCTLAYADLDGNVVDYKGNVLGNLGTRAYFWEIVNGNADRYCEYLETTQNTDDPRIIFSIPTYDSNGTMQGVLFCSKEISVLENSVFAFSSLFDSSVSIFVCDASGELIAANANAHDYFDNLTTETDERVNVFDWAAEFDSIQDEKLAKHVTISGTDYFVASSPLEVNGWYLWSMVDEASATGTYHENQSRIRTTVLSVTVTFSVALAYILLLMLMYNRRKTLEARTIQHNYDSYRKILQETHCAVIEYDIAKKLLIPVQTKLGDLDIGFLNSTKAYVAYRHRHPEFNFEEFERVTALAVKTGESDSFESFLILEDSKYYWLRMAILPIPDEDGLTVRLLFALFDISEVHQKDDTGSVLETYASIPGGIYRCNLNTPIHMEYFSDRLCGMLGYTREEVDALIGPQHLYSQLICEEDRAIYQNFVLDSALGSGIQNCEYRMMHKDGSVLSVSDSMEVKKNSSGFMYGYSIVTDLGKYKELQQQLERELEETRKQLEQTRVRNANSQMQPHFLYNALASIREIVLEDPEYASNLIYDFTTHLRACIRSMASDALIPFAQELENIKAYVNIEKMRFGDRLEIEYDCAETNFNIIPLSIQPLVENAIRHGVYERGTDGGKVTVRTQRSQDEIYVSVEDNGVGFDFERTMYEVQQGTRDSHGLYNLIFRFKQLMNATVSVESYIGQGTIITVKISGGEDEC